MSSASNRPCRGQNPKCLLQSWSLKTRHIPSGKHTKTYGKSLFSMGNSTISMVLFNSYVKLPEGTSPPILSWVSEPSLFLFSTLRFFFLWEAFSCSYSSSSFSQLGSLVKPNCWCFNVSCLLEKSAKMDCFVLTSYPEIIGNPCVKMVREKKATTWFPVKIFPYPPAIKHGVLENSPFTSMIFPAINLLHISIYRIFSLFLP